MKFVFRPGLCPGPHCSADASISNNQGAIPPPFPSPPLSPSHSLLVSLSPSATSRIVLSSIPSCSETSYGVWGWLRCKLPSVVWVKAPAADNDFCVFREKSSFDSNLDY